MELVKTWRWGAPEDIIGVDIQNLDELKRKLDELVSTGIAPRILSTSIKYWSVDLSNSSKKVFIIRISKSWRALTALYIKTIVGFIQGTTTNFIRGGRTGDMNWM